MKINRLIAVLLACVLVLPLSGIAIASSESAYELDEDELELLRKYNKELAEFIEDQKEQEELRKSTAEFLNKMKKSSDERKALIKKIGLYDTQTNSKKNTGSYEFTMKSTPNSSCFSEIGYDESSCTLLVRFRSSCTAYTYSDFSKEEYENFSTADSLGTYYNNYIKGKYVSTKQDTNQSTDYSYNSWDDYDYDDIDIDAIIEDNIDDYYDYLKGHGDYDENANYEDEIREWFEERLDEYVE